MKVIIYTDGSWHRKHNVGGIGVFMQVEGSSHKLCHMEGFTNTKIGRMELTAVITALELVSRMSGVTQIRIMSDSQYVVKSINVWLDGWIASGVLESKANSDLWRRYKEVVKSIDISIFRISWVRGHSGTHGNEVADKLASAAYRLMVAKIESGEDKNFDEGISFEVNNVYFCDEQK